MGTGNDFGNARQVTQITAKIDLFRFSPSVQADLTFPPDIERSNFGTASLDEPLGWVGQKGLHDHNQPGDCEERLPVLCSQSNRQSYFGSRHQL